MIGDSRIAWQFRHLAAGFIFVLASICYLAIVCPFDRRKRP
jgi:hypothetical protein